MSETIQIRGARVHNLQNVSLDIPQGKLVVITGLSGSGKSTLAFDTLFAEGRRRYVESLSAYARQFLGKIDKPEVDLIDGIAPAIAITQHTANSNPRSTVGTVTEIYDYLKLLFARIGRTFSPVSGQEVVRSSQADVADYMYSQPAGTRMLLMAPIALDSQETLTERLLHYAARGYQRVWREGQLSMIEDVLAGGNSMRDGWMLVVERLSVSDSTDLSELEESAEKALEQGDGECAVLLMGQEENGPRTFCCRLEADGIRFEEPSEHLFSFNSPLGACPECDGYGKVTGIDENLVIPDRSLSVFDDAVACWRGEVMGRWKNDLIMKAHLFGFPVHTPYYDLTDEQRRVLWTGNEHFHGLNDFFRSISSERYKIQYRVMLSRFTGKTVCPLCGGRRLRKEAQWVRVGGKTISDLTEMSVGSLLEFMKSLSLDDHETRKASRILTEITTRLGYLVDVGLPYLTLSRLSSTLSGGESQRIALSTALGSNLTGSMYILDEPSIGLHPRDTSRLVDILRRLRDLGNTVIVVEHEREVIESADWIVDVGPGAGYAGGRIVFSGPLEQLRDAQGSLTSDYLFSRRRISLPQSLRRPSGHIWLRGVRENNLKGMDVAVPLGVMTCVTGVSGSGKSSLVKGILYPAVRRHLNQTSVKFGAYERIDGDLGMIDSIELIDQNPIGTSLRSNPVTYTKVWNDIRRLFAAQPYAVASGMTQGHFSFNRAGGRCEECQGEGVIRVEMQFMADVEITCEHCGGKRFSEEVLDVTYRSKNVYDILEMTVDEAVEFFSEDRQSVCRSIVSTLSVLQSVGLGYVRLGQPTSTLSGGEIQRVKLATFLMKDEDSSRTLFIFDEPTTGLHMHDISTLMKAMDALVERGNTLVVVEHNMDVIRHADHVIDLGPEGGREGGNVVYEGPVDGLMACAESYTGRWLAREERMR